MPLCVTKYQCVFCGEEFESSRECRLHENSHVEAADFGGLKIPAWHRTKSVSIEGREMKLRMEHFAARWQLSEQPNNEVLQREEAKAFYKLDCFLRGEPYQQHKIAA